MKALYSVLFCLIICVSFAQVLPKAKYHTIKENKLAYYEQGQGAETVVLLHGWPQTSHVWRKVMPLLAKDYKVIAIDLPGLGNSDLIQDYSTEHVAQIIYQFLQEKQFKNIHLVGHDLGTWVAISYGISFESSLKTLTLVDAGIPGLMEPTVFQPENANKIWQFYFHSISDIPEFLIQGKETAYFNWYFSTKSQIKDAVSKQDEQIYVNSYKEEGRMKAGFEYYRAYPQNATYNKANIKTISIPILAVGGEKALADNVGRGLVNYSKNLTNISLPQSGHYVPEEQPQLFYEILSQFVNKK